MGDAPDNRSLGELFSELSRETGSLVRKEVELATTEMTGQLKAASADAATVAAGGALAHAGLLALIAAVVMGLSQLGVTPWLSALIVALLVMGIGYLLVSRGMGKLRRTSVAPTKAFDTLKETARWRTGQRT